MLASFQSLYAFISNFAMDNEGKNSKVSKKKVSGIVRIPTRIVHPLTGDSRVLMDHHDRLRFVMGLMKSWKFPFRKDQFSSEQLKTVRSLTREIFGGIQMPVIDVASDIALIVGVAGVIAPAVEYKWGSAIDQGSWAQVFDEVKVGVGKFMIYPIFTDAATDLTIFCIDYDNATALASSAAALAYDTREVYNNESVASPLPNSRAILPVFPLGIPDKSWIDTTDTTTVVAYLKGYGTTTTTAATFRTYFLMKVKFRQVN
jgi:hypothetical protein